MNIKIDVKPLSINDAFQGRRFRTKECVKFCNIVTMMFKAFRQAHDWTHYEIRYKFFLINHATTDYDNLIKVSQDCAVKAGLIKDDRFIYKATIEKIPAKKDSVEIEILSFTPDMSRVKID